VRFLLAMLACAAVGLSIWLLLPRSAPAPARAERLQVAATIFPLADWLREVGGADVDVHLLVRGGSNPHHFEPTIKDATVVTRARALFTVGLGLDEWARRLAANSGRGAALAVFETGAWITPRPFGTPAVSVHSDHGTDAAGHRTEGAEVDLVEQAQAGKFDPHYWLDPLRAAVVVARMAEELGKLDPPHADGFRQRAAAYAGKLQALNSEIEAQARSVRHDARIVTFHDAYGYLLDRLGIGVAAVIQVSPGVEPSAREVSEAIRSMRGIGQRTVFHEPADSGVAAQAVARELGARLEVLDPLDSEASSVGKTYLERVRHDVKVLATEAAPLAPPPPARGEGEQRPETK